MNEFEPQSKIMQARRVKPSDKFVMLCILKNVNWTSWRGTATLSYISKKYDINRRSLSRVVQRLKALGWISIYTQDDETKIIVKIDNISSYSPLDKMTSETRQNDHSPLDKMTSETRQNDHSPLDKMTSETRQNDHHNNTININNNNNNIKDSNNNRAYYRDLYLKRYNVDINKPKSYLNSEKLEFITSNNIKPSWKMLREYNPDDLRSELSDRATCLNIQAKDFIRFMKEEKEREILCKD